MPTMHKPGLGARKCGHCGARLEGADALRLRDCPQCRSPLYGRFVPAPTSDRQVQPQAGRGGGGVILVLAIVGLGLVGSCGAVAYAVAMRKPDEVTQAAPAAGSQNGPVLADVPTSSVAKKPAAARAPERVATAASFTAAPTPSFVPLPVPVPIPVPRPSASALALRPTANGHCTLSLSVGKFRPSSPTCGFNEKVSAGPGKLEFPCEGGVGTATFDSQTFRGSVTATTISLSQSEPFDFKGCSVVSTQRIFGTRATNTATYSYSEKIVGGSCGGVSTCTASATVDVR